MSWFNFRHCSLLLILLFLSRSIHAAACDTNAIPEDLLQLVKEQNLDIAVEKASALYAKAPSDRENAFILARVYINATLRSAMNINTQQLGFKPGESGSKEINIEQLKQATSDSYRVDERYFDTTDRFIHDLVKRWPEARNFYYCLTKIHFYSGNHQNFLKQLNLTADHFRNEEDEAVDFLIGYATEHMQAGRYKQAGDVYQTLLRTFPNSVPLISSLGVSYIKRGFTQEAMQHFENAYRHDQNDRLVIGNIAETAMLIGDFTKADKYLRIKASMIPDKADIYFDLAINAMHAGPKASLPYWDRYFEVHARHPDSQLWAGNARIIQAAAKQDNGKIELWHGLAEQMLQARVPKYAIPLLSYVDRHQSGDAAVSYTRAHAYDVGGHYALQEQALFDTLKRIKKSSNTQLNTDEVIYNLVRATYMQGKYDEALNHLSNLSTNFSNPAAADYMHGLIYRDRGDKQQARRSFESCLKKANQENSIIEYCKKQLE